MNARNNELLFDDLGSIEAVSGNAILNNGLDILNSDCTNNIYAYEEDDFIGTNKGS